MYEIGTEVHGKFIDNQSFMGKVVRVDSERSCYLVEYVSGPRDGDQQWFRDSDMNHGLENTQ